MKTKILVTLDFDEVISPVRPNIVNEEEWEEFDFGFLCYVRKSVIEFLNTLHKNPNLDIFWASSWGDSGEFFNKRSKGLFPLFKAIPLANKNKVLAAESLYSESLLVEYGKFVFVDDDVRIIKIFKKDFENLEALFVKPKKSIGLTDKDITKILNFIN